MIQCERQTPQATQHGKAHRTGSIPPALAKNARTGHPEFRCGKGSQNRERARHPPGIHACIPQSQNRGLSRRGNALYQAAASGTRPQSSRIDEAHFVREWIEEDPTQSWAPPDNTPASDTSLHPQKTHHCFWAAQGLSPAIKPSYGAALAAEVRLHIRARFQARQSNTIRKGALAPE